MTRAEALARRYLVDALIVVVAITTMIQVALDASAAAALAAGALVLPLLARRRFRLAAPAVVWVVAVAMSFADGELVANTPGLFVAGLAAALLLGQHPDPASRGLGLGVAGCALLVG